MKKILLPLMLIIVLLFSCSEEIVESKFGTISGVVLNVDDSTTVSNVEISTYPPTTVITSDKNGKFYISNVLGKEYKVTAIKSGFLKKEVNIYVNNDKTTNLVLLLQPIKKDTTQTDTTNIDTTSNELYKKASLVCYYPFNENYEDVSKNRLNGSSSNTIFEKSNNNTYIKLLGSKESYVLMDYLQKFNLNEFTYSFWINPMSSYGTDYQDFIDVVSRWGHWDVGFQTYTFAINKQGSFKSIFYNFNSTGEYTYTDTKNVISPNIWTNVTITYRSKIIKIYINGHLKDTYSSIIPAHSNNYGIKIGTRYDSPYNSSYFGLFDDLTVFSEALSDKDINSLYELQKVNK